MINTKQFNRLKIGANSTKLSDKRILSCARLSLIEINSKIISICCNFYSGEGFVLGVPKCATTASRTSNRGPRRLATS
jgi:hypothetical protein